MISWLAAVTDAQEMHTEALVLLEWDHTNCAIHDRDTVK